jgi:hypothetical protein
MNDIDNKMDKLNRIMQGCDEKDRETINSWGKMIKKSKAVLMLKDDLAFKEILQEAEKIVLDNRQRLSTDRDLTDEERKYIFYRLDFFEWFLGLFEEAQGVVEGIEREIDKTIELNTNN